MVRPGIEQAVEYLTDKGYRAYRGYPATIMPQIVAIHVAVVVQKAEPDATTFKAIVCAPKRLGMAACENVAASVASVWGEHGGRCTWGGGDYSETMGAYTVEVLGCWEDPAVEE